ncbi:hypothetical protein BP6252_05671 [Coleophoma cylindrospora]|uniref:Uncharacterized protein n=1 Tax=Coleophoma cylindrospora TaxID=1849047 RepID=A0A3D8RUG7_9HELO|nr:hypothetical protein BP6252_05671 [Coleophoma cylindrospora]
MQFTKISTAAIALLISTALALPAAEIPERAPEADAKLVAREDSSCGYTDNFLFYSYSVIIANGQGSGLCGGLLDNLRGQCGAITLWTCNESSTGTTSAFFNTPTTCSGTNVGNAIYVATEPNLSGVTCVKH